MANQRRQGVIDPGDARADLAQRVEQHQPLGLRPGKDRLGREQPADRQADQHRAAGRQIGHQAPQVGDDQSRCQRRPGAERAVGLAAKIVAERAEALGAQGRSNHGLPMLGRAGQRIDEYEGRRFRALRLRVQMEQAVLGIQLIDRHPIASVLR